MNPMTVITETRGTPWMPRCVLAQQMGISPRTVDERMRELKESNRYGDLACIKDGGLVLINYLAFVDFVSNREKIRNKIPVPPYDPRKIAKEMGWY